MRITSRPWRCRAPRVGYRREP